MFLKKSLFLGGALLVGVISIASADEDICLHGPYENKTSQLSKAKVECKFEVQSVGLVKGEGYVVKCKDEGYKSPRFTGPRPTPPLCHQVTGKVVTVYYDHY